MPWIDPVAAAALPPAQAHSIKRLKNLDDQLELRALHWSFYPCVRIDSLTRFVERWDSPNDEVPSGAL